MEVGGISIAEGVQPVERVLEGAGDRALVHRAAPQQLVCLVACLDQLGGPAGQLVVLGVTHRKVELAKVEEAGLGTRILRSIESGSQGSSTPRGPRQRTSQADGRHLSRQGSSSARASGKVASRRRRPAR